MTDDDLTPEDRQMIAEARAESRRRQMRALLAWTLILAPGIPFVLACVVFFGPFLGGGGGVVVTVMWAFLINRLLRVE
jgi:hypothetical protein